MKYLKKITEVPWVWIILLIGIFGGSWYFYPYEDMSGRWPDITTGNWENVRKSTRDWIGIRKDNNKSISTRTIQKCKFGGKLQNNILLCNSPSSESSQSSAEERTLEMTETSIEQSPKKLWDILGIIAALGIPLAVYIFQLGERKKAENTQQEAVFQSYLDRVSAILADDERKKKIFEENQSESSEIDIVRIYTVNTMKNLKDNHEKFNRLLDFLREYDLHRVIFRDCESLNRSFSGIRFYRANLSYFNFSNSNLTKVDFCGAELSHANFSNSNLTKADFSKADLSHAIIVHSNTHKTKFKGSNKERLLSYWSNDKK